MRPLILGLRAERAFKPQSPAVSDQKRAVLLVTQSLPFFPECVHFVFAIGNCYHGNTTGEEKIVCLLNYIIKTCGRIVFLDVTFK